MGYHRAGFDVTGVDNRPQPRYPFAFIQADALEYVAAHGHEYDVIHASPPCQRYSITASMRRHVEYPDLLGPTRTALLRVGVPWIIENVPGAPMSAGLLLCGTMFGLRGPKSPIHRHRYFESSLSLPLSPATCNHSERAMNVYTSGRHRNGTELEFLRGMGVTWATTENGLECIPPAYTEWIGHRLMAALTPAGARA